MVVQYQAQVEVDGEVVAPAWDGTGIVAIADITIRWGRKDLYEPTPPATLSISVIDRNGDWATDNNLNGKPVVVRRLSPDKAMFRGLIDGIKSRPKTVSHPDTGQPVEVFIVTLTATDKLGALAQARIQGSGTANLDFADGFWTRRRIATLGTFTGRFDQMMERGVSAIVSSIADPNIPATLGVVIADVPYARQEPVENNRTMYELIAAIYALVPLGHVSYNADTDGVVVGKSAQTAGMELVLDSGVIRSVPVTGLTVDAGQVISGRSPEITSNLTEAIDSVQFQYEIELTSATTNYNPEGIVEGITEHGAAGTTRRTLQIYTSGYDAGVGSGIYGMPYLTALRDQTVALIDDVNGRFNAPKLIFDFRRFTTSDSALDEVLLATMDYPTPLYFARSVLNHLPNFGPQFQLVGATVNWIGHRPGSTLEAGWVVEMNLAPATGAIDNVSIEDLVTNAGPAMEDFDPDISLAELGDVTIGLA